MIGGDPTSIEGVSIAFVPNFGLMENAEYMRGREEILQYVRYHFTGFSISIKKLRDDLRSIARNPSAPLQVTAIANDKTTSRLSFLNGQYGRTLDLAGSKTAIDTWAQSRRGIGRKGMVCYKYVVPKHLRSGYLLDQWTPGNLFPPGAAPSLTLKQLVAGNTDIPNNEAQSVNVLDYFILASDYWPQINDLGYENVQYNQTCTVEMRYNFYFAAYGKVPAYRAH